MPENLQGGAETGGEDEREGAEAFERGARTGASAHERAGGIAAPMSGESTLEDERAGDAGEIGRSGIGGKTGGGGEAGKRRNGRGETERERAGGVQQCKHVREAGHGEATDELVKESGEAGLHGEVGARGKKMSGRADGATARP